MLLLCETYAEVYNIRFNSIHRPEKEEAKSDISIEMKNGNKITMFDKCKYLGTTLYSDVKRKYTPGVVRYLIASLNNSFSDLSFVDSSTLSRLCDSYCMNLYRSQLFDYNDIKTWNYYMLPGENKCGKYRKYHLDLMVIYYITLIVVIPLSI